MKAVLITVGDELLIGQVVNTNASWIGERCAERGIKLVRMSTVRDDADSIRDELDAALSRADVVFVTGGLGPTHDDITRDVVADYFKVPCELNEELLDTVKARFARRGIAMPDSNYSQAMVPRGFRTIKNAKGSAPGLWHTFSDGGDTKQVILTPGVPHEMKTMFMDEIFPRLSDPTRTDEIITRTILLTGIGESTLAERFGDITDLLDENLTLAYLPGTERVRVRLMAFIKKDSGVAERLDRLDRLIHERAGRFIYGYGTDTLEASVGKLLIDHHMTVATAESCTGGLLSSRLTDIPGSSAYQLGGVVAYSNESKMRELAVLSSTLDEHGAVSREVALEMAEGVRQRFGADLGVATTGILGPDGGSKEKPVGTVWVSIVDGEKAKATRLHLGVDRIRNKERATTSALDMMRLWIS